MALLVVVAVVAVMVVVVKVVTAYVMKLLLSASFDNYDNKN